MNICILRLIADGSFFMAVFNPILQAVSLPVRAGLLFIPAAWALWLLKNWNRRNMIETVREAVFLEARLLLVIGLFEFVLLRGSVWKRTCAPYALYFLVSSILLLRGVRLKKNTKHAGSFWINSGWELFALLAAAFAISARPVSHGIFELLTKGYQLVILPLIELFLLGMIRVLSLIWPFLSALFSCGDFEKPVPEVEIGGVSAEQLFEGMERADPSRYWRIAGVLLLSGILFSFFYYLFRRLSEGSRFSAKEEAGELTRSRMAPEKTGTGAHGSLRQREKNIRFYYRAFLKLCLKHGVYQRGENETTDKIGQRAEARWGMEAELTELRSLYLNARYGEKKEDTAQKRRMKEIYKMVKEKANGTL